MNIQSERPIALFDLDGVITENPKESLEQTVSCKNYWHEHWTRPLETPIHQEVVDIIHSLIGAVHIIILTARPDSYRPHTIQLLDRLGIMCPSKSPNTLYAGQLAPILHMFPCDGTIPSSSAAWKQGEVKRWLDQGAKIMFMMEDYRPNAEAVRALVPVLLYERKKPSKHLKLACYKCGGLAACWCSRAHLG